jgi:hypothetical protein
MGKRRLKLKQPDMLARFDLTLLNRTPLLDLNPVLEGIFVQAGFPNLRQSYPATIATNGTLLFEHGVSALF